VTVSHAVRSRRRAVPSARRKRELQERLAYEILRCISVLRRRAREAGMGDAELEELLLSAAERLNQDLEELPGAEVWPGHDRATAAAVIPVIARGVVRHTH